MFSEIFIDDYCNFNRFKIDFPNYKDGNQPNLNILVGRNGSGKSSLLDALFEIGKNNLKTNYKEKYGNVPFDYEILHGNSAQNVICSNIQDDDKHHPDRQNHLWDKVIRLYTGHTKRQNEEDTYGNAVLDLESDETKWALPALFMSGKWQSIQESDIIWNEIQKIVLGGKPDSKDEQIKPRLFWIETDQGIFNENGEKTDFKKFLDDSRINKPEFTTRTEDNGGNYRHYWDLSKPVTNDPRDWSLNLLINILAFTKHSSSLRFYDTGFLFNKYPDKEKLFPDQSLSDGEHAFFTRFALLMILKESTENEKYLILLDEPETHFNEYWKTYFLYLVCEILKNKPHDVFIATHSAMLITDAKPNEIHRIEARESGAVAWPVPIKTFGANVVDIGVALFRMESDIGERSRQAITNALKNPKEDELIDLLKQVGPGEWRWKIRAKLKEIQTQKRCINYATEAKN